uniref:Uncharacterized protein n=1 Tax=Arundo donax TaxID=35708 RepID=A0A0A9G9L8_ARUDO
MLIWGTRQLTELSKTHPGTHPDNFTFLMISIFITKREETHPGNSSYNNPAYVTQGDKKRRKTLETEHQYPGYMLSRRGNGFLDRTRYLKVQVVVCVAPLVL